MSESARVSTNTLLCGEGAAVVAGLRVTVTDYELVREDGISGQAVGTVITLFSYSKVIVKAGFLLQDKLSEL